MALLVACLRDIVTGGGERRVGGAETIRWVAHVVTQPALFAPEEPQSKLAEPQLVVAFVLGGEGAAASRGQLRVSEPTPRRGGAPVIPGVHGVLAEEHALHLLAVVAVPVARVVAAAAVRVGLLALFVCTGGAVSERSASRWVVGGWAGLPSSAPSSVFFFFFFRFLPPGSFFFSLSSTTRVTLVKSILSFSTHSSSRLLSAAPLPDQR